MRKPFLIRSVSPVRKTTSDGKEYLFFCIHCSKPATREALFKDGGFTVVERYCESCVQPDKFEEIQKQHALANARLAKEIKRKKSQDPFFELHRY